MPSVIASSSSRLISAPSTRSATVVTSTPRSRATVVGMTPCAPTTSPVTGTRYAATETRRVVSLPSAGSKRRTSA